MKNVRIIILITLLSVGVFFSIDKFIKKDITIIDNAHVIKVRTFRMNLSYILDEYNFNIGENDKVSVPIDSKIVDNMIVEIERSFRIDISVDNEIRKVFTTEVLVKDLLKREHIEIEKLDKVYPSLNSNVKENDIIKVVRVEKIEVEKIEDIPFTTIIKLRPDIEPDIVKVESEGVIGKKRVKYVVTTRDGIEIDKNVVEIEIIEDVQNEVIYKGFDKLFVTSRGMPFKYKEIIIMEATAYDLSFQSTGKYPDHPAYGITYSGTKAKPGTVAVDKRLIELGSKLYIESLDNTADYGFASAEDTGSDIKGNRIDLFITDHNKAMQYGRRNVRVYVLNDEVSEEEIKGYSERRIYERN